MSQAQLYFDEDAAERAVVEALRKTGIDVSTAIEAGMREASDEHQLEFAIAQKRVLYSLNVADFFRLHADFLAAGNDHYGIAVIPRQRYSIGEKIRRLQQLIATVTAEEMVNRFEFL